MRELLARSLGDAWAGRAGAIAALLDAHGLSERALEPSVRGSAIGGRVRGARMMIEGASAELARGVLACLPVDVAEIEPLLAHVERGARPAIVGWDASRTPARAKIYLNLSDASASTRERVARELGVPGAPHVIGANLGPRGVRAERKSYLQLDALPEDAPALLRRFADGLALAGVVRAVDSDGAPRAIFVGPRHDAPLEARLRALPGWDERAVRDELGVTPGPVRSVGVSADGTTWTVYVKPRGSESELWALEPVICVRSARGEIGVFVAPASEVARAYARIGEQAVSYRVREGAPSREDVERTMRWALERLRCISNEAGSSEGGDAALENEPRWDDPPEGLRVVAR